MITVSAQRRRLSWGYSLAFIFFLAASPQVRAQGCSQCREAVGETPAATQAAYRRAIGVMVAAGATVFAAALVTFRRFR